MKNSLQQHPFSGYIVSGLLAFLISILLNACSYKAQPVKRPITPMPTFRNGGEVQVSAQPTAPYGKETFSVPFSLSYSPIDHFGINLAAHLMPSGNDHTSDNYEYYEAMLGWYPISTPDSGSNGQWRTEFLAGVGLGKALAYGSDQPLFMTANYYTFEGTFQRYRLQFNISQHNSQSSGNLFKDFTISHVLGFGLSYIRFPELTKRMQFADDTLSSPEVYNGTSGVNADVYLGIRVGNKLLQAELGGYMTGYIQTVPYDVENWGMILRLHFIYGRVW